MGLTRRAMMPAAALALGCASLACPGLARAAPRRIGLAAPDGAFQALFQSTVIEPWRKTAGDTEVFYYPAGMSGQILTQLRQQRQAPLLDVVLLDVETTVAAAQEGLVDPLTPDHLPVMHELIPLARSGGGAGPVVVLDCLALIANPGLVKQDIGSWKLLWDGTIGRQIALAAPPDPAGFAFTLIADRIFGRGDLSDGLKGGLNAIEQIAGRFTSWNPRPTIYDYMIDGNASLGIGWNAMAQIRARRAPGYLKAAIPREGSVLSLHTACLVKGAREPDLARAFISYTLTADTQRALAERMAFTPVNARTTLPAAAAGSIASSEQVARMINAQTEGVARLRWPVTDQWRQRILRGGRF